MTTFDFFDLTIRIEELSRDIYLALALHSGTARHLRGLFRDLADEEAAHAGRLRLLALGQRGTAWSHGVTKRLGGRLEDVLATHEQVLWEVRHRRRPGDLPALLDRLSELEGRFGYLHAEALVRDATPGVARLFALLAAQDGAHSALLARHRAALMAGQGPRAVDAA